MKKLISLLTISTLTASVPAPLLSNTVQNRVKRDVVTTGKDVTTKIKLINGSDINFELITNVPVGTKISGDDKKTHLKLIENDTWYLYKNNIEDEKSYFNKAVDDFFKKSNKLIFDFNIGFDIKIKNQWIEIFANDKPFNIVDNKWYFVVWKTNNWNITKFKNNEKIEKDILKLLEKNGEYKLNLHRYSMDYEVNLTNYEPSKMINWPWRINDGTYFKAVYRWNGTGKPQTPKIDSNGNITDWIADKTKFQQGVSFLLAENIKTATWSNDGMRLTVDGEININIYNSNVEEVYWDGAKQNMLDHKVKINVKPETSEKTHKLVIKYDINGTKYTSEDIDVVMAAKIEPPKPIVKENLSDVIKFDNINDLGNIIDNNDDTIKAAVTNKNSCSVDFSQIEISKTDTQATLSAIEGSKSYQGSVVVKYNVVPATTVELKIDLTSSASGVQINSDYLAQLDRSKMTNKVDTFYHANGKSVIKIKQPSTGNVITGVVYGCDENWNKTSQSKSIDPISGLGIDKGQYGSVDGRYLVELQHKDLSTHTKTIYLQVSEKQKVENYWDTPNGKNFEQWAEDNGEKNIRGSSASHLNNLFAVSKTWKQSLKHLDLKLDNFVVDNIKNVTQDEIDNYKTKILASVKSQVEKYSPDVLENTDYFIGVDNLVAGDWTVSKDIKVQSVSGSTKLLSFSIKTIPVQQKDQPIPPTPTPDNEKTKSFWKILGIVVCSLAGLGLVGMLLWRYWLRPWRMKIRNARSDDKRVAERRAQWAKEEAKAEQENKESENKTDDGYNS